MATIATPQLYELAAGLARANDLDSANAVVMGHLGEVVPSRGFGVYVLQPDGHPSDVLPSPGVPAWFLDEYERSGRPTDPVYATARRSRHIAYSAQLLDWRRWRKEPVYQVLDKVGFQRSLQAPVDVRGEIHATLNLARSTSDRPYSTVEIARLNEVRRIVCDVYTRVLEDEDVQRHGALSAKALDAVAEPVVVSSALGETLLANRAARAAVTGDGRTLEALCAPAIREGVRELRATTQRAVRRSIDLGAGGRATIRTSWLGGAKSGLVVSYLYRRHDSSAAPPIDHAPLTPRQRELVALVGRGRTVEEIAAELYISTNTVKQHLKRVYARLGVRSRAQLVQALWQSASRSGAA